MAKPGDVVLTDYVGVHGVKRRPAIVLSSDTYHQWRPDIIVGMITGQVAKATTPTDYLLRDWQTAGLVKPSAFRAFLYTAPPRAIISTIGHATDHDWQGISTCVRTAMAS